MTQFQLFDSVQLLEPVPLIEGDVAPEGTPGAIVEVFNKGEAFLVELFGQWVKYDDTGDFIPATQDDSTAFMETLGVETVYPHQIKLLAAAREVMGDRSSLRVLANELSDDLVAEVLDFAEFLKQRRQKPLSADG
ncbi:DUF2281 domain-containing protein [Phormidium tenue]|uniref:DUF2281 domain-containing protein n=1 Tax=Phormidium tenue NIES-30 TaxID=549789 RepID=A0A1U7IYL3_9CYAN|nr:DUF2281 domain-containing protein [Phormidium tenue]MBD2232756.1 DUF2281 domain-containing protein [Phormidium tenue FACHB-1052]OKH43693.1 hypothetical protein NIES30_24375 [Phormidium tenue NIES-30]